VDGKPPGGEHIPDPEEEVSRRVAIVTGANSGIGRAVAVELAQRGLDIGFTWHGEEQDALTTARQVQSHRRRVAYLPLDLSSAGGAAAAVDELADLLGGLHVFVNNAATGHRDPFLELDLERWRHVMEVDLTGAFVAAQAAARLMVAAGRGGRIVNVTSVLAQVPLRDAAAYCAAKGGLEQLTRVMALELASHGITVNSVAPGEIASHLDGASPDSVNETRPALPARRPGVAREVAAVIAFLASTEATYVTGASYVVDGGMLLTVATPDPS
jgi:hypothetical protein